MPPLYSSTPPTISTLFARQDSVETHAASEGLQVICAWPLSSHYGIGARLSYYALITVCVFARKTEWLKKACLAATLLLPAVASLHAIVLAAVHVDGAVDLDIYGAFQLLSIGILIAPVTVRLSSTYFNARGRNTIFLWAGLILAGLLSLTIEFYRTNADQCKDDNFDHKVSPKPADFKYNTTCGLRCAMGAGPVSPMRGGAANDYYVIPAPHMLTFDTTTLLCAGCCIYAVLWLASMFDMILEINWRNSSAEQLDEPIAGTNGATKERMNKVNKTIKFFLGVVMVPVFGGAAIVILIVGERNLFSPQLLYQIEPMSSFSQWAPIVGTLLGVLGSLYILLAEAVAEEKNLLHHRNRDSTMASPEIEDWSSRGGSLHNIPTNLTQSDTRPPSTPPIAEENSQQAQQPLPVDGGRRRVAKLLIMAGNQFDEATRKFLDDSKVTDERAHNYPEVPGESNRNPELLGIRERFNPPPSIGSEVHGLRSRANSFTNSISSGVGRHSGSFELTRVTPPSPPSVSGSIVLPSLSVTVVHDADVGESPVEETIAGIGIITVPSSPSSAAPHADADLLQVPQPAYHRTSRMSPPAIFSPDSPPPTHADTASPSMPS